VKLEELLVTKQGYLKEKNNVLEINSKNKYTESYTETQMKSYYPRTNMVK
jgi:hypothetical protein